MPLEAPKLDTRTFDDLVRDAQRRIPRYSKDWTDFNDSDPGMTLVQLFAWLTETMLFEMNRLPELNYIKFLQLLNIAPAPPAPAIAEITFSARPNSREVAVVPERTQVAGESLKDQELIVFETMEDLELIRTPLTSVEVLSPWGFRPETPAHNDIKQSFYPFGPQPRMGDALYLGFEATDPGSSSYANPFPGSMRFHVFRAAEAPGSEAVSCGVADRVPPPPVSLTWEAKTRSDPPQWEELPLLNDETAGFTQSGCIQVAGPRSVEPSPDGRAGASGPPRYWLRCRIGNGAYAAGRAPRIERIEPNTVQAISLATVRQEIVGVSDGRRNQTFHLQGAPVDAGSIDLAIKHDDQEEAWIRRLDFLGSGNDDPHYVVEPATAEIKFGDGEHGRIPFARSEIIAKHYRFGGGEKCTLPAGRIQTLLTTTLTGVQTEVTNLRAAVGGRDEQSVEDLKRTAPQVLRHRNRAVTADDYADIAARLGGVVRATVMPLHHPDFPGARVSGAVTVVVLPDFDPKSALVPPEMNDDQLSHICRELNRYRVLTAELFVKPAKFIRVHVSAVVETRRSMSFERLRADVCSELNAYLDPMARRFGEDIHPSRLLTQVQNVTDVVNVSRMSIHVDGKLHPFQRTVDVPPDTIVWGARDHDINITVGPD